MSHQDNIDSFRKEIFQLVADNKIPEAIGKLIELYKSPEGTYYDDLLILSRQFKDLTDRQLSGLLKDEDANIEKNQITHGLINIITNLHTDPVASKHFGLPQPKRKADASKKRSVRLWLIPLILIIAIASIFIIRNRNNNRSKVDRKEIAEDTKIEKNQSDDTPTEENVKPRINTPTPKREVEKPEIEAPKVEREIAKKDEPATEPKIETSKEETPPPPPPSVPTMSVHSTPKNAKTIKVGQTITENFLSRNDVHYYQFQATQGGLVDFKLINLTPTYSPTASVINPGGNRLFGTMARKGDPIITAFRAKNGERYGIVIGIRNSDPGKYTLVLTYQ